MYMIALSKGQFHGQPWVNPDRTTVADKEIASGPISGYRSRFLVGKDSWAFVRSKVRSSAGSRAGAGCGASGRWGRSRLWSGVSEGVVVVVRRLGEWVDRRIGQRGCELVY